MSTSASIAGDRTQPGDIAARAVELRVRYCECDPMGVAHHASFAPWFELARTELLRRSGRTYAAMEASGIYLVVASMEIRFRRPVRYDDVLRIGCEASMVGRARLRHDYAVELLEPGDEDSRRMAAQPLATGHTILACVDREARPTPVPDWLRELAEA
ncbi:MAG: thioesterase family protein [Planctomycetota bacterium]